MRDVAHTEFLMKDPLSGGEFGLVVAGPVAVINTTGAPFGHTPPSRPVPAARLATATKRTVTRQLHLRCAAKGNGPAKTLRYILDHGFGWQFLNKARRNR